MEGLGKVLIIIGAIAIVLGVIFIFGGRIPVLGKLPGDILVRKDAFTFFFPVTTFLILSIVLSLIINLIIRLLNK